MSDDNAPMEDTASDDVGISLNARTGIKTMDTIHLVTVFRVRRLHPACLGRLGVHALLHRPQDSELARH